MTSGKIAEGKKPSASVEAGHGMKAASVAGFRSVAGAVDADGRCRVEFQALGRNILAAAQAVPVITVLNALEGRLDALNLKAPAAVGFQGHGLILKGVHARQAAYAGLIKFHRSTCVHSRRPDPLQLLAVGDQFGLQGFHIDFLR